jgi:hypothetical protein
MRNSIYFSAILGLAFLAIRFIGLFIELNNAELFLFIGLGILLLVTLPLYLIERLRYEKKKASILKKHRGKSPTRNLKKTEIKHNPDYPSFRKQKSGLTWGGGNIHGSSAKRGSKRGFLRH